MAGEIFRATRGVSLVAGLALPFWVAANGPADSSGPSAVDGVAVSCAGQKMSVHAVDVPIRSVLAELSRRCDLTVIVPVSLDDTVSLDLEGVSPQLAAKRILRGRSFVLSYSRPPRQHGNRLWVFADATPVPTGAEVIRPPAEFDEAEMIYRQAEADDARVTDRLRDALAGTDRNLRVAAAETLGELGGTESAQALAVLLSDPDAEVRESTADSLGQIGGDVAIQYLRHLLLADSEPVVREAAEDNLAELQGRL